MNKETPEFYNEKDVFGLDKSSNNTDSNIHYTEGKAKDLSVTYATLGSRIVAYLLDVIILLIPMAIIEYMIFGSEFTSSKHSLMRNLIDLAIWTIYYGFFESSKFQATIGKKICGLIVIDEYGNRLTFRRAAFRYLAQIISIIPLGFGIWAIAKDKKKQAWHDTLLACFVVKKNQS